MCRGVGKNLRFSQLPSVVSARLLLEQAFSKQVQGGRQLYVVADRLCEETLLIMHRLQCRYGLRVCRISLGCHLRLGHEEEREDSALSNHESGEPITRYIR